MGTLDNLLDWWNLLFALPIALSILLLVASAVGGLESGSHTADTHAGVDGHAGIDAHGHIDVDSHAGIDGHAHVDVDPHADVDGHAHADVDGHAHADVDGHGDAGDHSEHAHPLSAALKWAGIGVVPLSLLAQSFLLFFGIVGLSMNQGLAVATNPEARIWISLLVATLAGFGSVGVFGALGRRYLPTNVPAIGKRDLIGRIGRVVFPVSITSGTIQVRDATGTLHQVAAHLATSGETLEGGSDVLVTGYDGETGVFLVDESPFTLTSEELRSGR